MKLSKAYELYERDKKILGFSDNTFKAYRIQLNLLIKYFGDIDVENITYEQLKEYLSKDYGHLKMSSIGHRIRFIRSIFRYLHEEGYLTSNPASKLKEPKQGKRIPKFIDEINMEYIKEACETPREKALINLLYSTGCRIGEVHQMNKRDINWNKRTIRVIGKGDKERTVFFDTKTYVWLKEYLNSRTDNEEALFVTERQPFIRSSIWSLRYTVKRVAKRANVNINIYPHRFRHSFATHLINNGASLDFVGELLGHSRSDVTMIYAFLGIDRKRELYNQYF